MEALFQIHLTTKSLQAVKLRPVPLVFWSSQYLHGWLSTHVPSSAIPLLPLLLYHLRAELLGASSACTK
jgi:hypothetical protein